MADWSRLVYGTIDVAGKVHAVIEKAAECAMRAILSLIEPDPTPSSMLIHRCNCIGLRLRLTREVLESLPPHPAWAALLRGKTAGAISDALQESLEEAINTSRKLVPIRPLWMIIDAARDLDSGMTFRASESDRIINDAGQWKATAELANRVKESNRDSETPPFFK